LAAHFGVSVGLFGTLGSIVVPAPSRQGTGRVSHHHIGRHSLIWADPDLESELADWHRRRTPIAFDELRAVARSAQAELLGHGLEHVVQATFRGPDPAPEITVLDGAATETKAIVQGLFDDCSEEDLDEAEFEIDALDPYLVGWTEAGRLLALAGGRPEEMRPGCMDIGVLVHPEARRSGRGQAVVAVTADRVCEAGHVPLYRCDSSNIGSQRLCRAVGFELVMELDAFRWPAALPGS
jgi:GNAT superfamily N-acetyltransferase